LKNLEGAIDLHFLLGGQDLEMQEIEKILLAHGYKYTNLHLPWGATLSAYKEFFNNYEHFIGIELITDCTPPKYYTLIDHHNEKSDLPSSIEQVANFIGITLDRFQMLVAEK